MLCISSQLQHMDPVTLTEPLLLWEGFSYPKWKSSLHFFSALFKQNKTLKGQENTARLKSFHPRIWLVSISGPWTEMRNEHYQGIPSSPRSQAHIYHHRHFFKEEISIHTPALLHTCRRQWFLLLDTSQTRARGSPDSLETQPWMFSTGAQWLIILPQMRNHELLGLITESGNSAPSPKLLPSTSRGLFLSKGIHLLTVPNKNSCLDFHLSPVANITEISSPGLTQTL